MVSQSQGLRPNDSIQKEGGNREAGAAQEIDISSIGHSLESIEIGSREENRVTAN